jgi:hypothetical protein
MAKLRKFPAKPRYGLVSRRALIQRINRKIAGDWEQLKTNRSERWYQNLGDYYVVNVERNFIVETHIDLEDYGRKVGVLKDWEKLEEGEA